MLSLQQTWTDVVGVADFGNYIETGNPFGLARPPHYFLQAMFVHDRRLVIFPSMQEPVYRFCRRRTQTPPILSLLGRQKHPDLGVMFAHRLVGICAILPGPHWGPALMHDIKIMDDERMGGCDRALDAVDRLEEAKAQRQDALALDELDQRGVSAWEAMKLRQGSTVFVGGGSGNSARARSTQRAGTL